MALAYAEDLRNNMLDEITAYAGANALIRIYDGTRPATGGTATTKLAELTAAAAFAPGASGGDLTADTITDDASADATGQATWFRVVKSDGTFVMDGDVDDSGGTNGNDGDMILGNINLVATGRVTISSFVITEGNP